MPSGASSSPDSGVQSETFAAHCAAVNASRLWTAGRIALGATPVVGSLEYLMLVGSPDVAMRHLWTTLGVFGVVVATAIVFLRSATVRAHADVTCAAALAGSMAMLAVGESAIGGFETSYAGIASLTPIAGVIFLMPFARRLWTVSLPPAVYFVTFLLLRPSAYEHVYAFVPVFHSILGICLSVTFGGITYRMARDGHGQGLRLAGEASRLDAAVRERTAEGLELARNLVSLEETNRTRIARELHDELGQELTAARLEAGAVSGEVEERCGQDAPVARRAAAVEARIALAQQTVKDVVFSLRPPALDDYDLATALYGLVDCCRYSSGLAIAYDNALDGAALTETQATTLFRVLQEGLTNVVRHAHAHSADVRVGLEDGHVVLRVADDGRGVASSGVRVGFGLRGMRERLRLVAGELSLVPGATGGTVLRATFPLDRRRPVAESSP